MTAANPEYRTVKYEKLRYVSIGVHQITQGGIHEHGVLELGLVLEGQVRVDGRLVPTGGLLLFNAYEPHTVSAVGASAKVLYMWISGHFARDYFSGMTNLVFDSRVLDGLDAAQQKQLRQLLLAAARSYFGEAPGYQLECVGHVDLLLTQLLRSVPHQTNTELQSAIKKKNMSRMRRIADYIEQHHKEKLTLTQLAREEGLTTAYMSRVFRELFDTSFQEYLNLLRLERALPLLRDPKVYLVDVCMECGFSDTRYLNSVCQKTFGCSATQYRRQNAGKGTAPLVEKLQSGDEVTYTDRDSLQLLQAFREQYT